MSKDSEASKIILLVKIEVTSSSRDQDEYQQQMQNISRKLVVAIFRIL